MDPHRNQHRLLLARYCRAIFQLVSQLKPNYSLKNGDPWESRTPVCGVRGRRLNHLTNGPSSSQAPFHSLPPSQKLVHFAAPPLPIKPASLGFDGSPGGLPWRTLKTEQCELPTSSLHFLLLSSSNHSVYPTPAPLPKSERPLC